MLPPTVSTPKFQGISILKGPGQGPMIAVQGSKSLDPYGIDAININSAVVARSPEVGELCQKLEAGEAISETTIRQTLIQALNKPEALDYSIQASHLEKTFAETIKDYFLAQLPNTLNTIANKPLTLVAPDSDMKENNDVYVIIQ